jgi:NADH-ubiquinone oxidoreductase chain 5
MAAPTPVSALVHSSTLVTAGVYLLIRFFPLLDNYVLFILFYLSTLTMFMAGVGALFEYDIKKVIALSTLRQLGLIIFVLSLGFYLFSYFHLLTHAMFKSLLFLCAGAFIHGSGGFQDIRYFGFVIGSFPYVSFLIVRSSLALCGFPYLAGFYSKDKILEVCIMREFNLFCVVLLIISTLITSVYSLRLIRGLCMREYKVIYGNKVDFRIMVFPMGLLLVGAIVTGRMIR